MIDVDTLGMVMPQAFPFLGSIAAAEMLGGLA